MKTKLLLAVAVVAVGILVPAAAQATCSGAPVDLTNNKAGLTGVHVVLCIDTVGGNTQVTLDSVTRAPSNYGAFEKIFVLAWNGGGSFSSASPALAWTETCSSNCGGLDGFGKFDHRVDNSGASAGFAGIGQVWTISRTSTPTGFAAHVGFANGCTIVVSDVGQTNTGELTNASCAPIPEPGTLVLFGSGLLGVAGNLRRKLLSV